MTTTARHRAPSHHRLARPGSISAPFAFAFAGASVGLALQAIVAYLNLSTQREHAPLYWSSLTLIYVATSVPALLSLRDERRVVPLLLLQGLALYSTRLVLFPTRFVYHDELIHENILRSILSEQRLFSENSILPAAPYYPGLELTSASISSMTGLSPHVAGTVVLILARIVTVLALYHVLRMITQRGDAAALGVLLYTCNPQYVFFNSQYSYQSLALPLCFLSAFIFLSRRPNRWRKWWPAFAVCCLGVVSSHHLTSFVLAGLFVGTAAVAAMRRRLSPDHIVATATITVLGFLWTAFTSRELLPYLSGIADNSFTHLVELFKGQSTKTFFKDSAGGQTPSWERFLSLGSVVLICVLLVPSSLRARHLWGERRAAAIVLALTGAIYPALPLGHLTDATAEVVDRASSFVFVGLAFLFAWWATGSARVAPTGPVGRLGAILILTVLFVGQTVVASGPDFLRAPGRYLVEADSRSVDTYNIAAASWMGRVLPAGGRTYGDRAGLLLVALLGRQHALTNLADGVRTGDASRLLLDARTGTDAAIIRRYRIKLLYVDRRLSTGLPKVGVYIDNGEFPGGDGQQKPPAPAALVKFDGQTRSQRLYDNGYVSVYDVSLAG